MQSSPKPQILMLYLKTLQKFGVKLVHLMYLVALDQAIVKPIVQPKSFMTCWVNTKEKQEKEEVVGTSIMLALVDFKVTGASSKELHIKMPKKPISKAASSGLTVPSTKAFSCNKLTKIAASPSNQLTHSANTVPAH